MGVLRVSCVRGCACLRGDDGSGSSSNNSSGKSSSFSDGVLEVDAHGAGSAASVLAVARLDVTQAADCELALEVAERTSSGEHKFKARRCSAF